MKLRVFSLLVFCLLTISCQYFSSSKDNQLQELDTIINFSEVDVSPTFKNCESYIDKQKQTNCFRNTIQQKVGEKLTNFSLKVNQQVDEIVTLTILINQQGKFEFQELQTSVLIKEQLPKLDSVLQVSIENLPKIYPAIKRGIPVATQYNLPIRIKLEE